jgi:hypothetical protein
MKFRERSKLIKFPVFANYRVRIVVSNDIQWSIKKIFRLYDIAHQANECEAMHIWIGGVSTSYLVFPNDCPVGTIAHECWHCVRKICDHFGSEFDDEMVAYHLGYLTQEAFDFIYKK